MKPRLALSRINEEDEEEERGCSPADWMAGPACCPPDCSCWKSWAGWKEERWTGS